MQHEKLMKSIIIKDFRSFYEEIIRLKAKALSGTLVSVEQEGKTETGQVFSSLCEEIQSRLLEFLTIHKDHIERHGGGFAVRYYQEAQYIMVALADEIFLTLPWVGREEWRNNLLERQVFHTQLAGEKFFDDLDRFLAVHDVTDFDRGILYLLALGLGFQGKYRDREDQRALKDYRLQLGVRIIQEDLYSENATDLLFPNTYENTLETRSGSKVPSARFWITLLGAVVLTYFVTAYTLWTFNIHNTKHMVMQLKEWTKLS